MPANAYSSPAMPFGNGSKENQSTHIHTLPWCNFYLLLCCCLHLCLLTVELIWVILLGLCATPHHQRLSDWKADAKVLCFIIPDLYSRQNKFNRQKQFKRLRPSQACMPTSHIYWSVCSLLLLGKQFNFSQENDLQNNAYKSKGTDKTTILAMFFASKIMACKQNEA